MLVKFHEVTFSQCHQGLKNKIVYVGVMGAEGGVQDAVQWGC